MSTLAGILGSSGLKAGSALLDAAFCEGARDLLGPDWLRKNFPVQPESSHHDLANAFYAALEKTLTALHAGSPLRIFKRADTNAWPDLSPERQSAIEKWFQDLRRAKSAYEENDSPPWETDFMATWLQEPAAPDETAPLDSLRQWIHREIEQRATETASLFAEEDAASAAAQDVFVNWLADHLDHDWRLRFLEELKPKNGRPSPAWVAYDQLAKHSLQQRITAAQDPSEAQAQAARNLLEQVEACHGQERLKKVTESLREAERSLVLQIRTQLRKLSEGKTAVEEEDHGTASPRIISPQPVPAAARYFGNAALVEELVEALRQKRRVEITGAAGMGKTALAAEAIQRVMQDAENGLTPSPFLDGVFLLDLRQLCPSADSLDTAWGAVAAAFDFTLDPVLPAKERAAKACAERNALLVLEGAEVLGAQLDAFLEAFREPRGTALVLTRDEGQTRPERRIQIDSALETVDALALLRHVAGAKADEEALKEVLQHLGGHPLALTWAGQQLREEKEGAKSFLEDLRKQPFPPLSESAVAVEQRLRWLFERGVSRLPEKTRSVLSAAARVAAPFDPSLATAVQGTASDLQRLARLGWLYQEGKAWRFSQPVAAEHASTLPLSMSLLKKLGQWALAQVEAVAAFPPDGKQGYEAQDRALAHATAVLAHDAGGVLDDLYRALVYHGPEHHLLGIRRGRLDLSRRALEAAEQWMAQALHAHPEDASLHREASVILNKLGDLALAQNDVPGARRYYQQDKKRAQRQAESDPAHTEWQHDLSSALHRLGHLSAAEGNLREALRYFTESHEIRQQLAMKEPDQARWQRALSLALNQLGDLAVRRGDLRTAVRHYNEARNLRQQQTLRDPAHPEFHRDLSVSLEKLGDLAISLGALSVAQQHYAEARSLREALVKADPDHSEGLRDLSILLSKLGDLASTQGDLSAALRYYSQDRDISQKLAQADPANAIWQRDLAVSLEKLGDLAVTQGDLESALRLYTESRDLRQQLAQNAPNHPEWQRDLAISHGKLGALAGLQGDLTQASSYYTRNREIARCLAERSPDHSGWQSDLSASLNKLGDVALAQGDVSGAEAHYTEARDIQRRLSQKDSANAGWQSQLSLSLIKLGDVTVAKGDASGAYGYYAEARKIRQSLAQRDPENAAWQRDLAMALIKLGDAANDQSALLHYSDAKDILAQLTHAAPAHARWQEELAVAHCRIFKLAKSMGDETLATEQARSAYSTLQALKDKGIILSQAMKDACSELGQLLQNSG